MKKLLILVVLFLPVCAVFGQQNKPNIIFIMADDLGYGDIGCYGNRFIETPEIDKLAANGLAFMDYHSNGPVCTPTRAALMTGNYQQRAGLEGVIYADLNKREHGISSSQITIAEYLKTAGYATGIFGKWHLGYKPDFNPTLHGFDEFYGYVSGNVDYISHRDGIGLYDWWHNKDTCYDQGYVTDLITDYALKFMEKNKTNPFFVYLPHEAPHFPYQGRSDKADRLPGVKFEGLGSRVDKTNAYKEMVEIMDENIGRVVQKLKELKIEDNSIVIFCSDNGATKEGDNGMLRGFKGSLWEGGHRVPALVWYPQKIKSGRKTNATVLGMDWLPTLLSVAGIDTQDEFDGIDISPVLFSQNNLEERPVFWRYRSQSVVRKDNWKYLVDGENEFLFNLEDDIQEQNNLVLSKPSKAQELKTLLESWENEMNDYKQLTN